MSKEARTRIKINNLLDKLGWNLFDTEKGKLEYSINMDDLGEDFEHSKKSHFFAKALASFRHKNLS